MKLLHRLIILFIMSLIPCSLAMASESYQTVIQGISGKLLKNVQDRLAVVQETDSNNMQDYIRHAPDNIQQALQPFGYFKATVDTQLDQRKITFIVRPGPALTISNIDIKITGPGKNDPELQKFINHFPLSAGQVLTTEQYEHAKDQLFEITNNQGYLKAVLEKKEIRVNLKKYTAEIVLSLNTGPRYYFGHVLFSASPYAPSFLQRFVPFEDNEPFSSQKLLKFQQDLRNSHYFQQADASPNFEHATDNKVPVDVALTAPKSQRYDIGVGYGTFTGARLTLGTDFRRTTDTGQHFNAQLKLSSVLSGIALKYFIPGKNPITDQYTVGANVQYFAPKNGRSFSQLLSGSYGKTYPELQHTTSLNYLNEGYQVVGQTSHQSQVLYPSYNLSWIKADNIISPRFGNMINFTIQGASQDVFSKTNFFQSEIKDKAIFSPTRDSRVIVRGDIGYTVVENLNQLPLTLRYFAGGIGSVRGYPLSSIGPGRYLEVGSLEVQHTIIGKWNGALFYDVGNASNTFNGQFNRGAGAGIIYKSILGPIQIYVGRALSKPDKPYSIEFSMGPDF